MSLFWCLFTLSSLLLATRASDWSSNLPTSRTFNCENGDHLLSVADTVSAVISIDSKEDPLRLSVQNLINCVIPSPFHSYRDLTYASVFAALDHAIQYGIFYNTLYQRLSCIPRACSLSSEYPSHQSHRISGYHHTFSPSLSRIEELLSFGPLVAAVELQDTPVFGTLYSINSSHYTIRFSQGSQSFEVRSLPFLVILPLVNLPESWPHDLPITSHSVQLFLSDVSSSLSYSPRSHFHSLLTSAFKHGFPEVRSSNASFSISNLTSEVKILVRKQDEWVQIGVLPKDSTSVRSFVVDSYPLKFESQSNLKGDVNVSITVIGWKLVDFDKKSILSAFDDDLSIGKDFALSWKYHAISNLSLNFYSVLNDSHVPLYIGNSSSYQTFFNISAQEDDTFFFYLKDNDSNVRSSLLSFNFESDIRYFSQRSFIAPLDFSKFKKFIFLPTEDGKTYRSLSFTLQDIYLPSSESCPIEIQFRSKPFPQGSLYRSFQGVTLPVSSYFITDPHVYAELLSPCEITGTNLYATVRFTAEHHHECLNGMRNSDGFCVCELGWVGIDCNVKQRSISVKLPESFVVKDAITFTVPALGDSIFGYGGLIDSQPNQYLFTINSTTGRYERLFLMEDGPKIASASFRVIQEFVYFFGGKTLNSGKANSKIFELNFEYFTWSTVASLPGSLVHQHMGYCSAVLHDSLYIYGGNFEKVVIFNTRSQQISYATTFSGPPPLVNCVAFAFGGDFYVGLGHVPLSNDVHFSSDRFWRYIVTDKAWNSFSLSPSSSSVVLPFGESMYSWFNGTSAILYVLSFGDSGSLFSAISIGRRTITNMYCEDCISLPKDDRFSVLPFPEGFLFLTSSQGDSFLLDTKFSINSSSSDFCIASLSSFSSNLLSEGDVLFVSGVGSIQSSQLLSLSLIGKEIITFNNSSSSHSSPRVDQKQVNVPLTITSFSESSFSLSIPPLPSGPYVVHTSTPSTTETFEVFISSCPIGQINVPFVGCESCGSATVNLNQTDVCYKCPQGSRCKGGNHFEANPGYFRQHENSTVVYRCVSLGACPGGEEVPSCAEGATGPLCGICEAGYIRLDDYLIAYCRKCPSVLGSILFSVFFISSYLVFNSFSIKKQDVDCPLLQLD
ncbi:hypothetical protein GEMRC1_010987 [Eukaryota sp. GEM-RC1]